MVDYFEDTPGPTALAEVNKLLLWWTRYVSPSIFCVLYAAEFLRSKVFGGHLQAFAHGQRGSGASVSKLAMQRAARERQP